ncbi:inositol-tetrakisphosphate 1-kinase 4-like isoform X2 [Wolffia australiana]
MVVVGGIKEGGRWDNSVERMLMSGITPGNEEDRETGLPHQRFNQKLEVGYALTPKKVKRFLQPRLELLARKKGISFVAIDQNRPLCEQGPFDIVLHKLSGKEWHQNLEDYQEKHPEVIVLDPPRAIKRLHNRQSMLQDVVDLNLVDLYGRVGVPKQLVVALDPSSIPESVVKAGLVLPLRFSAQSLSIYQSGRFHISKPLVIDGTSKSHELSIAYDHFSLSLLEPPLLLQEFVNHGGVVFKVYVVGEAIKVVRRFSLPDVTEQELLRTSGIYRFPRVSCAAASADCADLDPAVAELPPRPLLERLARELRHRLLFNMDIIRQRGSKDRYFVIDINYFPGYGKLPGYELMFIDFLSDLGQNKPKRHMSFND